jgi:hypothetical protein
MSNWRSAKDQAKTCSGLAETHVATPSPTMTKQAIISIAPMNQSAMSILNMTPSRNFLIKISTKSK